MQGFRQFVEEKDLSNLWDVVWTADHGLPPEAQKAVTDFVGGHTVDGKEDLYGLMLYKDLDEAFGPNPSEKQLVIRQQLEEAVKPVHQALRQVYRRFVPLYRAQRTKVTPGSVRYTLSFSLARRTPEVWKYDSLKPKSRWAVKYMDQGTDWFVDEGDVDLWDIPMANFYPPTRRDAEKMARKMRQIEPRRQWVVVRDDEFIKPHWQDSRVKLIGRYVPVEDVIWVTDRINQKEFIVKNKEYVKFPFEKF